MGIIGKLGEKFFNSSSKDNGTELPPIDQAQDQGPDEQRLVNNIKEKIDLVRSTNSRIAIESIYMTNLSYLLGFTGVYYDTTYRMFKNIDPRRRVARNRFRVNKILPTIQNRLARLTQNPPRYDVLPESPSSEDKDAARLGVKLITDVWDKNNSTELRQELEMVKMQGGCGYIHVKWDPTLGKPMVDPDTDEFVGYEGDVRLDVYNCLEVYPDPLCKKLEDAAYIILAKVRKLDYFKEQYPERGHAVKQEDCWLLSSLYDLKSNALTAVGITGSQTSDQTRNSAIELVYYEKRSREYPMGRMVVTGNGVLLEDKELPVEMYDVVKFDDVLIGGRYNSEAIITHLRPVQDQYNITRNRMAEWIKKNLAGKYLVARGSELMEEAINNDDSEVLEYTPVPEAPPPTVMNIPQIPSYAYTDLQEQDKEFDFISGINEVSRGSLPSASIPAAGMAFLQEQDQTRIGVTTFRNEVGFAKVGQLILRYVGKNYVMPRLLKEAGDGLEYTVKEFVGKDLRDNYDVKVVPGSTIPSSKVLKRQDIINAYQLGAMGNPQDDKVRMQLLKSLEFGDAEDLWKSQALDDQQIKRAIGDIEQGVMPRLSEFDNHNAHLVEMNDYRKGDKFLALDEMKQGLFLYVMEWHLQALTDLANPGLAQQKINAEVALASQPMQTQNMMQKLNDLHPGSDMNSAPVGQAGQPAPPPQTETPQQMPQA